MKAKVVTVILAVAVAGSVFFNVKQYNEAKEIELAIAETNEACTEQELHNSELESQIADAQAKLESVKSEISALGVQIETATAEKESLQDEVVVLQAKVDQKHLEEEEAAKKAAEEAEAAKKAASKKSNSSDKIAFISEDGYVMTEAENQANLEALAAQLGAEIVTLPEEAHTHGNPAHAGLRCE